MVVASATAMAIRSLAHRGSSRLNPASRAAPASGTTIDTGMTAEADTARSTASVPGGPERVGVQRAGSLVHLHYQREQQGGHRGPNHHIGERQRLHDGVDGRSRMGGQADEHRGVAAAAVPDLQQQDVGGGLRDRQADHQVNEVAAGHDTVEADEEEPGDDAVGQDAHPRRVRMTAVWSRNSEARIAKPPATSTPTTRFSSEMVPPEIRFPVTPRPTTLLRKSVPASRPSSPMRMYPEAPIPSEASSRASGWNRSTVT